MRNALLCGMLLATASAATFAASETTELLSVHLDPTVRNSETTYLGVQRSVSRTGRYTVFVSGQLGLAAEQLPYVASALYLRDREAGVTTALEGERNGIHPLIGSNPTISGDGRFIAFEGYPANFSSTGDLALRQQIFVLDRQTRALELISIAPGGGLPNDYSAGAMISGNGRFVTYYSAASDIVPKDTNGVLDIFQYDRNTHTTRRVNVSPNGNQTLTFNSFSQWISHDGRYVLYNSSANNLVSRPVPVEGLYLYDRTTGRSELESVDSRGVPLERGIFSSALSDDGRYVLFTAVTTVLDPSNPNPHAQAFVRDRTTGRLVCVSLSSAGEIGNDDSSFVSIDAVGRYVSFSSLASNLVPGDTNGLGDHLNGSDVFVHDMKTGATSRASVASDGTQGFQPGLTPLQSLSADGKWVAFESKAPNLVPEDGDAIDDVFIHENRGRFALRVNAGGKPYTDHLGREWVGDKGFDNPGNIDRWVKPIANTQDGVLYRTDHKAAATTLNFHTDVPNDGTYLVRLHFAENHISEFAAGARTFDVRINGVTVFPALDIFAAVGARTALVKEATVTVLETTGINVQLVKRAGLPVINAIEVIER